MLLPSCVEILCSVLNNIIIAMFSREQNLISDRVTPAVLSGPVPPPCEDQIPFAHLSSVLSISLSLHIFCGFC